MCAEIMTIALATIDSGNIWTAFTHRDDGYRQRHRDQSASTSIAPPSRIALPN